MTGTAKTEEVEFEKTYKLETTIVPTNRVRRGRTGPIRCTKFSEVAKWRAVANETAQIHKQGRRCWWAPPLLRRARSAPY